MAKRVSKQSLSIIIPSYRQEKTIVRDVLNIKKSLTDIKIPYEIIVVVDGQLDNTSKILTKKQISHVKTVGYKTNHGKGYAVRFGMANAKGAIVAFIDAGMDLNPKGIVQLLEIMKSKNADIVIGSKLHPDSIVIYPWQRKLLSWGYRTVTKALFGLSVRDTQVGLKIFRRKVLEDVLPRLLVKRYAFDIEILAVAYNLGYRKIYEAPIQLTFGTWSSITSSNFWNAVLKMFWDTCAVYYRLKILHYYDNASQRKWKYDPELNFRINLN